MAAKTKQKKMKLKLTPGHILIEPLEAEKKTSSGIYLPESASEKPQKGKVLSVGGTLITEHGAEIKPPVKAGDIVIYKKWGGNEVKMESKEYLFVKFEDILAIED